MTEDYRTPVTTHETAHDNGRPAAEPGSPFSVDARQQIADFIEGARWFGGKGRGLTVTAVRRLGVIAESAPWKAQKCVAPQ